MTQVQVLDFYAEWCQPCKQIAKILPRLEQELDGIATIEKIDIEQNQDMASKFGIRSIPTFVIMNGEEEVQRYVGVTPLATIEQRVKEIDQENRSGVVMDK